MTLEGMTSDKWQSLSEAERHKLRDHSNLTPALVGQEGNRIEVTYPDGEKRRYWVGKSTGWRPCHLEIPRSDSSGGASVYWPEGTTFRVVRQGPRR